MRGVYYSGLKFKTKEIVDRRLCVSEMTTQELTDVFGEGGKYADDSIFTFNKSNGKFYQYTGGGATNPNNWQMLVDTAASFPTWDSQLSYAVTSCVSLTDGSNNIRFYIATSNTAQGESPLTTSNKWFEIGQPTTSTGDDFRELLEHTIDPDDSQTHEVVMFFNKNSLATGEQPNISVYGDFGETEAANYKKWERIHTNVETWVTDTLFKIRIKLTGDLSDFEYDNQQPTIKNLRIIAS